MKGLRHRVHVAPRSQKDAISDVELIAMVRMLDDDLAGARDRVLLTWGWTGAFRRGELVNVQFEDLVRSAAGIVVNVRHSKTDQEGVGDVKVICAARNADVCPLRAFDAWIATSGITRGPIFRGLLNGQVKRQPLNGVAAVSVRKITIRALPFRALE